MNLRTVGVSGGLMLVSLAGASSLVEQRQAALEATRLHAEVFPKHLERCLDVGAESHTDVVAFPAGRADRVYIYGYNRGRAYLIRGGQARLVWCGERLLPERRAAASAFRGNAARALSFPFRTAAGALPVERGEMDIFRSFAGRLSTLRMSRTGEIVCSQNHFEEGELRTAFQLDARDICS
ncbi:hypothetical protein [Deinococcus budaensis]|uniref:Uncharacterized protein n=1 Tax=Deinococcus budaensis TaxID=1665626 RepID=A0A7W8GBW5_9DEIO|nr:hypothetical protein [Deinococcus budaensis]MBB5232734.1 hypothetical protein [Deinococcus budaensis]